MQSSAGRSALVDTDLLVTPLSELTAEVLEHLNIIFRRFVRVREGLCPYPGADTGIGYCHAFVLGAVTHWNTIVFNQLPSRPLEIILADSRNEKLLDVERAKLEAAARSLPALGAVRRCGAVQRVLSSSCSTRPLQTVPLREVKAEDQT